MQTSFENIRSLYQHRLYAYAWYSLRDAAEAEDVVQEAFTRFWEQRHGIDPRQAGAWLMRVTQNLVTDQIRRRRVRDADNDMDADALVAEQPPVEDLQHQHDMKRVVEESLAGLTDPYRSILILREIQG